METKYKMERKHGVTLTSVKLLEKKYFKVRVKNIISSKNEVEDNRVIKVSLTYEKQCLFFF